MASGGIGASTHQRFDRAAGTYDQTRPGYPSDAIAWLLDRTKLLEGERVVDLGAGTGLLTRELASAGSELIAVEPNAAMRAQLEVSLPGATVIAGAAEKIELEDSSTALVTVGQAYHWLEPSTALPEIRRILTEGGYLAVLWIRPDTSDPLQAEIEGIARRLMRRADRPGPLPDEPLGWDQWFEPEASETHAFTQRLAADELADYVSSFSVVAVLAEAEREEVLEGVRKLAAPGSTVDLPFTCEVHLGRARA